MKRLVVDLESGKVSEETFFSESGSLEALKTSLIEEALRAMLSHREKLYPEWRFRNDLEEGEFYKVELLSSGSSYEKLSKLLSISLKRFLSGAPFKSLLLGVPAQNRKAFSALLRAHIGLSFRIQCRELFIELKSKVQGASSEEELPSLEAFKKSLPTFITRVEP